jgi:hypothetical protein
VAPFEPEQGKAAMPGAGWRTRTAVFSCTSLRSDVLETGSVRAPTRSLSSSEDSTYGLSMGDIHFRLSTIRSCILGTTVLVDT